MVFGATSFGTIAIARVPDPRTHRHGAIIAKLITQPKYQAPLEVQTKIKAQFQTTAGS